ncbi:MAG TPA: AsmA-like C-terminal region-containing protein [Bacteroidales bacterium]|nr:AsmA-like C-terminal region-containing protein [Bacteroidales bacterium]
MLKVLIIKWLKRIGILVGALFILLVAFSIIINIFFKDQLVHYLVNQLNKQINATIDVGKSDFTFWKTFPHASVEFEKVVLHPSHEWLNTHPVKTDTLLSAHDVTFQFNFVKLLQNKYVLQKIKFSDGILDLKVDESGNLNYDIFQKSDGEGVKLHLKNIVLRNIHIQYINRKSDVHLYSFTPKTTLSAIIQHKTFDFKISTEMLITRLQVKDVTYVTNRTFKSEGNLYVENNTYQFKNFDVALDNLNFLFKGTYAVGKVDYMDFNFVGNKINLSQLINFLPENYRNKLQDYTAKGILSLGVSIKGSVGSSHVPQLLVNCSLDNSTITEHKSRIKLEGLTFAGTFTNGSGKNMNTSEIQFTKFSSKIGFGEFSLCGKLSNLLKPTVLIAGSANLELNELKNFLKLDTFEILNGKVDGSFHSGFSFTRSSDWSISSVDVNLLNGEFALHNANVKLKGSEYELNDINGTVALDTDVIFRDITLKLTGNEVRLKGRLINGLPYLLKRSEEATIEAELFSTSIDLSPYFKSDNQHTHYSRALLFPKHLNLDIKLNINEFTLNRFKARWIKGYLQYKPTMFILKSLSLETQDGNLKGNGLIVQDFNSNFTMKGQIDVSKISIQKTFGTFNNFSQDVVRDTHLRGRLSGRVNFTSEWNSNLRFIPENLIVDADVVIANGELVNFEPLNGLSRFISLDELKNVKFSTLHNTIYIKDKQIIIPQMDINSSAFNISGSGIHQFDNHYQYKIKVLLSEFLYGKAKRAKKENEEYGRIEDDGLGRTSIYLTVDGFGKDYKITYDSKKTMDIIKESFVKQKRELKEIFHEEFGWFKKDSTLKTPAKSKTSAVQVQFDDEPIEKDSRTVQPSTSSSKKKAEQKEKVEVEWE